ncbi:hypothetical protein [Bacillus toyonensis]|uniref:hypothetical protein n=1 Tax=Bacillus toyonensis TaxID=155322 RepID=UPI000BF5653E|nr:hypothetical protein [Bacillus toyonensis]PGF00864.1 hypothetical protein COM61_22680 [Bacillus toyonensis]PHE47020.1 hypothetical protein COF71_13775 [Bacillus toyonensis]
MSEQTTIFDFLEGGKYEYELKPHEESILLVNDGVRELERNNFSNVLPLATGKLGHSAYRAVFEDKPCTVQIDSEGHIMFKHDDSRFFDYGGSV